MMVTEPKEGLARALDPEVLARLSRLEVRVRNVVEGVLTGMHKSPHHGSSVEFAEHKEYTPGDDIRRMDWKAYAKFERYYIKQFEEETNIRAYILLDASASMGYGSGRTTKFDYAVELAASLTYLFLKQQDAVGLLSFAGQGINYLPPRGGLGHLTNVLMALTSLAPAGASQVSAPLSHLVEAARRRAFIAIISDLYDFSGALAPLLKQLNKQKHTTVLFHTLDPAEIEFPFLDLAEFQDLEDQRLVLANPRSLREAYRQEIATFIGGYRALCRESGIAYHLINTATPLETALRAFLVANEAGAR